MSDPLFWLGLSICLVAVSLTAVLIAALPALQELARAARSAEKLFDTLRREFPPTLEAIRLTGLEISELTEDINKGVKNANSAIEQVDRRLSGVKEQALNLQINTRSVVAGVRAAWRTWKDSGSIGRNLPSSEGEAIEFQKQTTSFEERVDRGASNPTSDPIPKKEL